MTDTNQHISEYQLAKVMDEVIEGEVINEEEAVEAETPHGTSKRPLMAEHLTYEAVKEKVLAFLPESEIALKLILAVAVSAAYKNSVMLWLLLVGVPSSGKTDLVRLVRDADCCAFYLDNMTQNAFISGERETKSQKVHDLLPLLHKKCLIVKDWTSIFSLDEKMTKKLLGDFVGIYDQEFAKFSSRRGNITYASAFSQIGAITPATLNRHTTYMSMIGARFLSYTMPTTSEEQKKFSYDFIFSDKDRSVIEKEARQYVSSYLHQLSQKTPNIKSFSPAIKRYLQLAAELMANGRGIVILQSGSFVDERNNTVKFYEVQDTQIEEPWRAVQQLSLLSKYLCYVIGKNEVGIDEMEVVKEIVISSMPADRSQALRLIKEHGGEITANQLADLSNRSSKTSRRLLEELTALHVVDKSRGQGQTANDYRFSVKFNEFICRDTADFLSNKSSGTETPLSPEIAGHDQSLSLKDKSVWDQFAPIKPAQEYDDDEILSYHDYLQNFPNDPSISMPDDVRKKQLALLEEFRTEAIKRNLITEE